MTKLTEPLTQTVDGYEALPSRNIELGDAYIAHAYVCSRITRKGVADCRLLRPQVLGVSAAYPQAESHCSHPRCQPFTAFLVG